MILRGAIFRIFFNLCIFVGMLFACAGVNAKDFDSYVAELEAKYDEHELTEREVDSAISVCPDIKKYPELLFYKSEYYFLSENYSLYIKTLLEAKKHAKEFWLRYNILNNLGTVYLVMEKYDPAEEMFKEALLLAQEENKEAEIVYSEENLLIAGAERGSLEAIEAYRFFFENQDFDGDLCEELETLAFVASYYVEEEYYPKALAFIRSNPMEVNDIEDCEENRAFYFEVLAELAFSQGECETALDFLDKMPLHKLPSEADRVDGYKLYKKVYEGLGNNKKALIYNDSIVALVEKNANILTEQNTNFVVENFERQNLLKRSYSTLSIFLIVVSFIVIFLSIILFTKNKLRTRVRKKLFVYQNKYNRLWSKYQLSHHQLQKLKVELAQYVNSEGDLVEKDSQINGLLKELSLYLNTNTDNEHEFINTVKNKFITELRDKAPILNEQELLISFYLNLNLPHKKIGELLNKTEKSIDSYKYRINSKLKKNYNTDFDTLVKSLKVN